MKTSKTVHASKRAASTSSHNGKHQQADSKSKGPKSSQERSDSTAGGLRELFIDELKDIYWAEKALVKAIPKMAEKATSEELQDALNNHLAQTEGQVLRLEKVFEIFGEEAKAKKCHAMQGLIEEAEEIMKDTEEGAVRDAGIIAAAQKVEHYEIATYGTLKTFAATLGENEAAKLLEETQQEEQGADEKLTEIAESSVNIEAAE